MAQMSNIVGIYALIGIAVMLLPRNVKDCKMVWIEMGKSVTTGITKPIIYSIILAVCYIAWPVTLYGILWRK